ncbi:hypothetical protein GCM10020331_072070 [Ectobacillus funiculus]
MGEKKVVNATLFVCIVALKRRKKEIHSFFISKLRMPRVSIQLNETIYLSLNMCIMQEKEKGEIRNGYRGTGIFFL